MKANGIKHFYEFGSFRLDVSQRLLYRGQDPVPLPPKVFDTLLALTQNGGRVLEKDELMQIVWPDTFVEENNLNQNISVLRRVLAEGEDGRKYIETVPRRGYRFVAPVSESREDLSAPPQRSAETGSSGDQGGPRSDAGSTVTGNEADTRHLPTASPARRRLILPGLLLAALTAALSYFWFAARAPRVNPAATPKSIAVLPFKLLDEHAEDEYLGLGMADTLITRMGSSKQVIVRPTSAIRKYAVGQHDPAAVGRELQVDTVLEGSVRRDGDRIRVTVRLVNSRDGSLVWAEKFDESYVDMFRVEDSISEKVVRSLIPELTSEEKGRLAKRYTENPEAYQLYLIGRYHWSRANPEAWHKAIGYFNSAIEKDPNYALAHTGLADAYVSLAASDLPQTLAMPRAKPAALKALELDPGLTQVHVSLGKIRQLYDWDWTGAEADFRRALELSPNFADAHREYGAYLASMGRHSEGIAELKLAREIDPVSLLTNFQVAWALLGARRYDEAIAEFGKVLDMDPNYAVARSFLGQAYERKGMYDEAIRELRTAIRLSADDATARAALGHAYAVSGRRSEALKIIAELEEQSKTAYVSPYAIAIVHAGIGDKDRALAWLEKAYAERSRRMIGLNINPVWDGLRSDPRFADLLRRVGVPPK